MRETADIWSLVRGQPEIDPDDLLRAIEIEVSKENLDTRTRMLIRESVDALRSLRGDEWVQRWIVRSASGPKIEGFLEGVRETTGFPSLKARIAVKTRPSDVEQFLRELGLKLTRDVTLEVGGSISLILGGHLDRHTEDIDVVDEVPAEIRSLHDVLEGLQARYGLSIAHFQSHYLPDGWRDRLHPAGRFGRIQLSLVDRHDVFLGKLFSGRAKDRDDLRVLARELDPEELREKLRLTCGRLLGQSRLRELACENWYILFGEELPA